MKRRWLSWIAGIVGLAVVAAGIGLIIIYSGIYNVAANYPDPALVVRIMGIVVEHSVVRRAAGIKVPLLDDPGMVITGFQLYQKSCVGCHGAPGVEQETVTKSFNPAPPELVETAVEWEPNELFWLTKNGIRMTGMPAWDKTLTDDQIWSIVAAVRKLKDTKPEEYVVLSAETSASKK